MAANDVAFLTQDYEGVNSRGKGVSFTTGLPDQPIIFSAKKIGNQVRVDFSQRLRGVPPTTVAGNYTFTGPTAITTSSVIFNPGDTFLLLDIAGSFTSGEYILSIQANVVRGANFDVNNGPGTSIFDVVVPFKRTQFNEGFN